MIIILLSNIYGCYTYFDSFDNIDDIDIEDSITEIGKVISTLIGFIIIRAIRNKLEHKEKEQDNNIIIIKQT